MRVNWVVMAFVYMVQRVEVVKTRYLGDKRVHANVHAFV